MSDIFISYSRSDSKFVEGLILALVDFGWSVWSDKSGISEGRPFDAQIESAISQATLTLVVWSEASVKSRWVRAEAAFALDRDKLVPIIADGSDPPLQFLHIQGVNMADWRLTCEEPSFKKLAALLSERLDRVGAGNSSGDNSERRPGGEPLKKETFGVWRTWHDSMLPPVDSAFDQYFAGRTFFISQFVCAFGFVVTTIFGFVDILMPSEDVNQTRFRLLVTCPMFLILLALSFTPLVRRHSQAFVIGLGFALIFLVTESVRMADVQFPATTGAPTCTFMLLMAVMILLPLRAINAVALGFFAFLFHQAYLLTSSARASAPLQMGFSVCVFSLWIGLSAGAYFRERGLRENYLDHNRSSLKIDELKEKLLSLAVERHRVLPKESK